MQVITGRVEERTELIRELDSGNLKAKEKFGAREGTASDAYGNFAYFHLV